ncbi:hypothetical protein BV133_1477 [Blastochloris viridis]|uniref:Uncharacterized protein n=1 Tax=Blastochloris viridis TaxID=1079 RepID=A0A182D0R3_BLAVI|nr:hypothetical protein BV133_1477 [Blastochloris viridis]
MTQYTHEIRNLISNHFVNVFYAAAAGVGSDRNPDHTVSG